MVLNPNIIVEINMIGPNVWRVTHAEMPWSSRHNCTPLSCSLWKSDATSAPFERWNSWPFLRATWAEVLPAFAQIGWKHTRG